MPEADGFEVLEKVEPLNLARVYMAQTAMVNSQITGKVAKSKFSTYVSKPVRPSYFHQLLVEYLEINGDKPREESFEYEGVVLDLLVVEDNVINQKLITKVLERMGHKVDVADNGLIAIEMLDYKTYDLVFMDMLMPVMGGVDATKAIRKDDRFKNLPIVAMTANAMDSFKQECLAAGMDDFIPKPIKRDKVWDVFNKYCYERSLPVFIEQPRVLICEDDNVSQQMLQFMFQSKLPSVSLKLASDGVEACTLIGSFRPHLILTDVLMPNMDGVEVVKYMKGEPLYCDAEVMVMTSLEADSPKVEKLVDLGVKHVFRKPIKNDQLMHHVRKSLYEIMLRESEKIQQEGDGIL